MRVLVCQMQGESFLMGPERRREAGQASFVEISSFRNGDGSEGGLPGSPSGQLAERPKAGRGEEADLALL